MSKPVDRIAKVRKCDESEALSFCKQVQAHFKQMPSYRDIAAVIERFPDRQPAEIAELLPVMTQNTKKRKPSKGPAPSRAPLFEKVPESHVVGWQNAPKNPLRSENRLDPSVANRCPHGVLAGRPCRLCDPKRFDDLIGEY